MKLFLTNLLYVLLGLLMFFSILVLMPVTKVQKNSLYYSIIDKNELLKNVGGERIIFVGGSNLSFGLNSEVFEDSLGLHPVNTAIHAGIGLITMLDNTIRFIKKGDIVVVCPEYEQFFGDQGYGINGPELLITTNVYGLSNIFSLRPKQQIGVLKFLPKYALSKLKLWENFYTPSPYEIYARTSFNKYGDAVAHWGQSAIPVFPAEGLGKNFNPDMIAELENFHNKVISKGARCYFSFPSIQSQSFKNCKPQIDYLASQMSKTSIRVLGYPERYAFPNEMIFNTIYHLTKKGVDLRTAYLLEDLRKNGIIVNAN